MNNADPTHDSDDDPAVPSDPTFRDRLIEADRVESQAYDKTVLTLSGGALAVSLAFLKDIAPHPHPSTLWVLHSAWGLLTCSLIFVLASMLTGRRSIRRIIKQIDEGTWTKEPVGGNYFWITSALNTASGVAFVMGAVFLFAFAASNFPRVEEQMATKTETARPAERPEPAKPAPTPKREGWEGAPPPPPPPKKK